MKMKKQFDQAADEEYTERLRAMAIAKGQIVPSNDVNARHPYMSLEAVAQLRKSLIEAGYITPRVQGVRRGKRSVH